MEDIKYYTQEGLDALKREIPAIRRELKEELGLTLHPRKCYMQHYSKGVSFVGGIIKPHRIYPSKRLGRNAREGIAARMYAPAPELASTVNSYFGLLGHTRSYGLRKGMAMDICKARKDVSFTPGFGCMRTWGRGLRWRREIAGARRRNVTMARRMEHRIRDGDMGRHA